MAETDENLVELPLDGAGTRLRRAREAAGLQLSDIAARTRIAERHLVMIESGNFVGMASRAYAVGFARSYARTLGLDENAIAQAVREEMDGQESASPRYQPSSFEPGDPARVPSSRIAWVAALGAFAVVVLGYVLWRSFYAPAMPLPDLVSETTATPAPEASGAPAPAATGPVVFTALEKGLWVKFYDAAGNQLMQKQMAQGETYTVPPDANGPMIWTARPDALQVTVGGVPVARLSESQVSIKDVPVSAAALLARGAAPAAAPAPSATPAAVSASSPTPSARPKPPRQAARPAASPAPSAAPPAPAPSPVPTATAQSSTVSQ